MNIPIFLVGVVLGFVGSWLARKLPRRFFDEISYTQTDRLGEPSIRQQLRIYGSPCHSLFSRLANRVFLGWQLVYYDWEKKLVAPTGKPPTEWYYIRITWREFPGCQKYAGIDVWQSFTILDIIQLFWFYFWSRSQIVLPNGPINGCES